MDRETITITLSPDDSLFVAMILEEEIKRLEKSVIEEKDEKMAELISKNVFRLKSIRTQFKGATL